jgi:ribosomal protein S12 methylthiotransferase
MEVIIDKKSDEEDGLYLARSQYDAPEVDGMVFVKTKSKKIKPGDIVEAKIVDTYEYDLVGEYNDKK